MSDSHEAREIRTRRNRRLGILAFGAWVVVLVLVVVGPVSLRAQLAFAVGFEPWSLDSVTARADGGYLLQEHFSPQRGEWTRLTTVDGQWRVEDTLVLSDEVSVRQLDTGGGWVNHPNGIVRLKLSPLELGPPLADFVLSETGTEAATARLHLTHVEGMDAQGYALRVDLEDSRLPEIVSVPKYGRENETWDGNSWIAASGDGRASVSGPSGGITVIAPRLVSDGNGELLGLGEGVLVTHRTSVGGPRSLLSVLSPDGSSRDEDLAKRLEATSADSLEPVWAKASNGAVVMAIDIRDGRASRTAFVRLRPEGTVEVPLTLER